MKKITFIIAVSFSMLLTAQQDNNQVQETTIQTNNLETNIQQKIDKEVNSLNKDILENTKRTITNKNNIDNLFISKIGVQGLLLTLGLTFLSIFGIGRIIKRKTNKKIKALKRTFQNSIDNVKEAEIRTILHIKNAEKENDEFRKQSQILLVSEASTPINEDMQRIFVKGSSKVQFNCEQIKIKELTYKTIKNVLVNEKKPHPVDFELIIFDNSSAKGRKWNQKYIDDYMIPLTKDLTSKGIGVLYYSNDQYYPARNSEYVTISNKHLLTYANVYPHMYQNAMTVLKLQNLFKE